MQSLRRRIDLGEPARRWGAKSGELDETGERPGPGHLPVGLDPLAAATRVQGEERVHRAVSQEGEIDRDGCCRASASARLDRHVAGGGGVAELPGVDRDRRVPSNDGAATLELVYGEIDAVREQLPERRVHTVPPHQSLQITVLAAGVVEQGSVWARPHLVHCRPDQCQKARLAALQALAEGHSRLLQIQWAPQPEGQAADELDAGENVFAREG
jgi:hypothetical protein